MMRKIRNETLGWSRTIMDVQTAIVFVLLTATVATPSTLCPAETVLPIHERSNQSRERPVAGWLLPFKEGEMWTYRGKVEWADESSNRPRSRSITWEMRVTHVFHDADREAAVIRGFLTDLAL